MQKILQSSLLFEKKVKKVPKKWQWHQQVDFLRKTKREHMTKFAGVLEQLSTATVQPLNWKLWGPKSQTTTTKAAATNKEGAWEHKLNLESVFLLFPIRNERCLPLKTEEILTNIGSRQASVMELNSVECFFLKLLADCANVLDHAQSYTSRVTVVFIRRYFTNIFCVFGRQFFLSFNI